MRLLPREEKFFELFQSQVQIIVEAARLLAEGVRSGPSRMAEAAGQIANLEHRGDEVIHEIVSRLNQTFLTPLDPEDIHNLSSKLDDVLDWIEETAHRLVAYRVDPVPPQVHTAADTVAQCTVIMSRAFEALPHKNKSVTEYCIEVNRLEGQVDVLVRDALSELFRAEGDAIVLVKLKEIYDSLEETADRCEDVADVLQNVVVKNS
jgi:predicted phosphate transport protein (TIGR00153 family)